MVDGGNPCINQATNCSTSYLQLLTNVPITVAGTIKTWCTYCASTSAIRLRIYRPNGSNYDYVGGTGAISCAVGFSTHSANIPVQVGDFVGFYQTSGSLDCVAPANTFKRYKTASTDVTSNTPQSDWETSPQYHFSIGVTVDVDDYYVKTDGNDGLSGSSWANAWATIDKAATTVADGKTVHIGFGNYSQTNAQKIAPVNAGSIGIKYLPETAVTGGGTGEVKITLTT